MLIAVDPSMPSQAQEEPPTYSAMCYRFTPDNTVLPFLIWRFIDQFARRELRIAKHPTIVCVPATVKRLPPAQMLLPEPAGLLTCFPGAIDSLTIDEAARVRSQFGTDRGTLIQANMFCMPSRRAAGLSSYMCYDFVKSSPTRFFRTRITDLFGRREVTVRAGPDTVCVQLRMVRVPEPAGADGQDADDMADIVPVALQAPVQLFYTSSLDPIGIVGERLRVRTRFGVHTGTIGLSLGPFIPSSLPAAE
jgi:hypothetical protein